MKPFLIDKNKKRDDYSKIIFENFKKYTEDYIEGDDIKELSKQEKEKRLEKLSEYIAKMIIFDLYSFENSEENFGNGLDFITIFMMVFFYSDMKSGNIEFIRFFSERCNFSNIYLNEEKEKKESFINFLLSGGYIENFYKFIPEIKKDVHFDKILRKLGYDLLEEDFLKL